MSGRARRWVVASAMAVLGLSLLSPAGAAAARGRAQAEGVEGIEAPAAPAAPANPWLARRPLNIAHAGGDLEAPHETMYAYRRAVAVGTDVLELDIRLSSDGVAMVVHDETVDRTTNGTGPVRSFTAAQLQALDSAYWFVPGCWSCRDRAPEEYTLRGVRTGDRPPPPGYSARDFAMPTLREIIEAFPQRLLDIEIKDGPDGFVTAEAVAALVEEYGIQDRVTVVSFDDAILAHFQAAAPDVATSPGLDEATSWFFDRRELPGRVSLQVPPVFSGIQVVTPEMVADAHRLDLAVWVWFNGNDDDVPEVWNQLLDMGVDGLITGKPALLEQTLIARESRFQTALDLGDRVTVRGRTARVSLTCPDLAAAPCAAWVVVTTRLGRVDFPLGLAIVTVDPGTTVDQPLWWLVPPAAWPLLARDGVTVRAHPSNSDGAPATATVPVTRTR